MVCSATRRFIFHTCESAAGQVLIQSRGFRACVWKGPGDVVFRCISYLSSMISSWLSLAGIIVSLPVVEVSTFFALHPWRSPLPLVLIRLNPGSLHLRLDSDVGPTVDARRRGKSFRSSGFTKMSAAQRIAVFSSIDLDCAWSA